MQPAAEPCIGSTITFRFIAFRPLISAGRSSLRRRPSRCSCRPSKRFTSVWIGGVIPPAASRRSTAAVKSPSTDPPKGPLILRPSHSGGLWLAVITRAPRAWRSTTAQLQAGVGTGVSVSSGSSSQPRTALAIASASSGARKRRSYPITTTRLSSSLGARWASSWAAAAATGSNRSTVMSTPRTPRQPSVPNWIGAGLRGRDADAIEQPVLRRI